MGYSLYSKEYSLYDKYYDDCIYASYIARDDRFCMNKIKSIHYVDNTMSFMIC